SLGDGSLYHTQPARVFGGATPTVSDMQAAYVSAVEYDLRVLEAYLARHVTRRSLIILLGDHQPRADVTEEDPSWNVPVHVLSQDPTLLAPFLRRGFLPGVLPADQHARPMESFLPWFMEAFSSPAARAE